MFKFNNEQLVFKESARELVEKYIEKGANERNNNKLYPAEVLKKLGELGYKGLLIPEYYEGTELDIVSAALIIYEVAKSDASLAHLLATANFGFVYPILRYGSAAQHEKYLRACAAGDKEGIFAYVEPQTEIKTILQPGGEAYVLNGTKCMITNAPYADYAMVAVTNHQPVPEMERLTTVIVDLKNTPGVEIGKAEETMGLNSLKIAEIFFNNIELDEDSFLGEQNQGGDIIIDTTNLMRISNCAIALGIAERAYEEALSYARFRKIYSTPLIEMQAIKHNFADMKAELEVIKLLTFHTASCFRQKPQEDFANCAMAKYKATEKAKSICDYCLQIFGGYGYIQGNTIERLYRDIRAMTILGGDSDRLKSFLAMDI